VAVTAHFTFLVYECSYTYSCLRTAATDFHYSHTVITSSVFICVQENCNWKVNAVTVFSPHLKWFSYAWLRTNFFPLQDYIILYFYWPFITWIWYVINVHIVFKDTAIYIQYLSEGTNKNSVKNLLIILFLEQTDSPVAILHSGTA